MCEPVSSCLSSIWKKLTKKVCWERGHVILNRSIDPPAKLIQFWFGTCLFCSLFVKCPEIASGSKSVRDSQVDQKSNLDSNLVLRKIRWSRMLLWITAFQIQRVQSTNWLTNFQLSHLKMILQAISMQSSKISKTTLKNWKKTL